MRLVRLDPLAATGTAEAVVTRVRVTDADLRFEIPVLAEYPRVTVCHTETGEPPLIAGILEFAGVRAEKVVPAVEPAYIILPAVNMRA